MSAPLDPNEHQRRPRRSMIAVLVGVLVTLFATVFGLVVGATTVSAHTSFVGSDPTDGAVVGEPVEQITLIFTNVSEAAGDGFVVLDPNGQLREPTSVTTTDGKAFRLAFEPALDAGLFGVRWSVRAGDAHPIEGSFSFTVGEAAGTAAATDMSSMSAEEMAAMGSDDMSSMTPEEMAAMDDFLQVDETRPGETTATMGRLVSIGSIVLAIGFLVFAATTFRGSTLEIERLITAVRGLGAAIVVGAGVEYIGVARIAGDSLTEAWTSSSGVAILLRTLAGLGIAFGLVATMSPVRAPRVARSLSSAGNRSANGQIDSDFWGGIGVEQSAERSLDPGRGSRNAGSSMFVDPGLALARNMVVPATEVGATQRLSTDVDDRRRLRSDANAHRSLDGETSRRWRPDRSSWAAYVGVGFAVASFWFDGHTVTKGFRPLHAVANSVHVVAGSVWVGGVVAMAAMLWIRHREQRPTRALELVVRFSSVAAVALGAVVVAGLVMAVSILDGFGEVTSTQWGQTLLLKSAAAGLAMLAGAYNHFRLMPALERSPNDPAVHDAVRSTVTAEAIMLGFVVVVSAWLVAAAS